MSEAMERRDRPGEPDTRERISGPQNIRNQAEAFDARGQADAAAAAGVLHEHPAGLSGRVMASGDELHDMVERLRHRGAPAPEDLRPLAEALSRHCAATEATARRALDDRGAAPDVVRRDREQGEFLQRMLRRAMGEHLPEGTYPLTVGGVLGDVDQYVALEHRELVPAIEHELPFGERARLGAAFRGA